MMQDQEGLFVKSVQRNELLHSGRKENLEFVLNVPGIRSLEKLDVNITLNKDLVTKRTLLIIESQMICVQIVENIPLMVKKCCVKNVANVDLEISTINILVVTEIAFWNATIINVRYATRFSTLLFITRMIMGITRITIPLT